jgi:hypothetical protein
MSFALPNASITQNKDPLVLHKTVRREISPWNPLEIASLTLPFTFLLFVKIMAPSPPSFHRLWDSSPSVHSYLQLKARNSCLPHCPHFPSLLPFSSLVASLLWMFLNEFPIS